ncbi:hypothetical protein BD414DRAFT_177218 [Trametes punicea]|nr:hypothetical protein BD414DRAFT_177218 [Trametes punicea]
MSLRIWKPIVRWACGAIKICCRLSEPSTYFPIMLFPYLSCPKWITYLSTVAAMFFEGDASSLLLFFLSGLSGATKDQLIARCSVCAKTVLFLRRAVSPHLPEVPSTRAAPAPSIAYPSNIFPISVSIHSAKRPWQPRRPDVRPARPCTRAHALYFQHRLTEGTDGNIMVIAEITRRRRASGPGVVLRHTAGISVSRGPQSSRMSVLRRARNQSQARITSIGLPTACSLPPEIGRRGVLATEGTSTGTSIRLEWEGIYKIK